MKHPGLLRRIRSRLIRLMAPTRPDRRHLEVSHDPRTPLPEGAAAQLRNDHPRLAQLRSEYTALELPVTRHTFWAPETIARDVRLPWFRGDNAYVWQYRQLGPEAPKKMSAIARYVAARDTLGLMNRVREDGLFGCWTFVDPESGRPISRDLLDSVNELNFLERQLRLSSRPSLRIADIGAGYGRLAHRACLGLPNVERYDCFDAVPESTFLCEYYVRFRKLEDRARVIPLTEAQRVLSTERYDVAVNVHSFSECTLEGIRWWLHCLGRSRVPHLLIVPNHGYRLNSAELDGTTRDYAPLLEDAGYRLSCKEPVLADPDLRQRTGVGDYFMLYALNS